MTDEPALPFPPPPPPTHRTCPCCDRRYAVPDVEQHAGTIPAHGRCPDCRGLDGEDVAAFDDPYFPAELRQGAADSPATRWLVAAVIRAKRTGDASDYERLGRIVARGGPLQAIAMDAAAPYQRRLEELGARLGAASTLDRSLLQAFVIAFYEKHHREPLLAEVADAFSTTPEDVENAALDHPWLFVAWGAPMDQRTLDCDGD